MATTLILLLALAAQGIRVLAIPALVQRRAACYNGGGDINNGDGPVAICTTYCEHTSKQIIGPPVNVSAHVTCDTEPCPVTHAETYTSTTSFSIEIGGDSSIGDDTLKGGASVGASWNWGSSSATSNTFTFTPHNGDAGSIVFRPYYQQSCGNMQYFAMTSDGGDGMASVASCVETPSSEDPNACGQTPIMISDPSGNGQRVANGDFSFCYTAGPKAGQGC